MALLEEHTPALRRLCNSYCEGRSEAVDLFQDIALALWTALPRFRGECSERTWLYRIAHNIALTFRSKRRQQLTREQPVQSDWDMPSAASNVETQLAETQKQELLQVLVRELPLEDRRLLLLYLEGLSTSEMEAITGMTRSNVTVRLSRIRQRLFDRLQGAKAGAVRS